MQCDNLRTIIHLLWHFLIVKNHERKKTKQFKKPKQEINIFHLEAIMGERFMINKEPGTWVALSISKAVMSVPN